jgi:hypothetical protein
VLDVMAALLALVVLKPLRKRLFAPDRQLSRPPRPGRWRAVAGGRSP